MTAITLKNHPWRFAAIFSFCLAQKGIAVSSSTAAAWKGERLKKHEGVISFEIINEHVGKGEEYAIEKEPLRILVRRHPGEKSYLLVQPFTLKKNKHRFIYWKLPRGHYRVESISQVRNGKLFSWSTARRKVFWVQEKTLADLGVWSFYPQANSKMQVQFSVNTMQAFFLPTGGKKALTAIIDGFSKRHLQSLAHDTSMALITLAAKSTMPPSITSPRSVNMLYKMNLGRYQDSYQLVISALKQREHHFRQCYLDGLDLNHKLYGTVEFNFTLSKGKKNPDLLLHNGGSLKDQRTISCLLSELRRIHLPNQISLSGNLQFAFAMEP